MGQGFNDNFGTSLSLSENGRTVAVTAHGADRRGYVRVYSYDAVTALWMQVGSDISGTNIHGVFLDLVRLSSDGSRLAFAQPAARANGRQQAGCLTMYQHIAQLNEWVQVGRNICGETSQETFAYAIALSADGRTVAAGAPLDLPGFAQVYHLMGDDENESDWQPLGNTLRGDGAVDSLPEDVDYGLGYDVALSADGRRIAVTTLDSRTLEEFTSPTDAGKENLRGYVQVYDFDGTTWRKVGPLLQGAAEIAWFGFSLAFSGDGNSLAIGSPRHNEKRGMVQVYQMTASDTNAGPNWEPIDQALTGINTWDLFGFSVALSSDARVLAITALWSGELLNNAGHVSLYMAEEGMP